jgi:hypothetical protein
MNDHYAHIVAAHVEALVATVAEQQVRIKALEAALRDIGNWSDPGSLTAALCRAALSGENSQLLEGYD